ncbi:MAG: DUF3276 family protein [Bacteroidales bacterium]
MEDFGQGRDKDKDEVYTKAVKAGKRTYFMDVKEMKSGELYLTITESKRQFDESQSKFVFEKHKIFLYKEDFEKFVKALTQTIGFIETGEIPEEDKIEVSVKETTYPKAVSDVDLEFDNLGSNH